MKVLMVTNKVRTYALGFQNSINPLLSLGHEIVWAADFSHFNGDLSGIPCKTYQISINTSPLKPCNIKALKQIEKIITDEKIEAVICSTPIGGLLARLAAKKKNIKPVIYAAHGFLFFNGAPLINRTVYKLEEVLLAHLTDVMITITEEDCQSAQNFKLRSGAKPYLIHGAGIEIGKSVQIDREEKRRKLQIDLNAFVIVSAGFLNKNKNHRVVIDAIAKMRDPSVVYLICGDGEEKARLQSRAEKRGVSNQVRLLGYRTDMAEIMSASDVFVMPSFREGVPRSLLEAMDLGLPCVGSRTRGITELIEDERWLCSSKNAGEFSKTLITLQKDNRLRDEIGEKNKQRVGPYSAACVQQEFYEIMRIELGEAK